MSLQVNNFVASTASPKRKSMMKESSLALALLRVIDSSGIDDYLRIGDYSTSEINMRWK